MSNRIIEIGLERSGGEAEFESESLSTSSNGGCKGAGPVAGLLRAKPLGRELGVLPLLIKV